MGALRVPRQQPPYHQILAAFFLASKQLLYSACLTLSRLATPLPRRAGTELVPLPEGNAIDDLEADDDDEPSHDVR